jgi:hypothetical protein
MSPRGSALGPVAKTLLETSAVLPAISQLVQLGDGKAIVDTVKRALEQPKPSARPGLGEGYAAAPKYRARVPAVCV